LSRRGVFFRRMKQLILKLTPPVLARFLIRLGAFYQRHTGGHGPPAFPSQEAAFQTLKSLGWRPRHGLDVGAYHGVWTNMFLTIFPDARILMLEGQAEKEEQLKLAAAGWPGRACYEIALLGAADDAEVEFVEMETGSSVFEESSHFDRRKTRKKLVRLDTLLQRYPDFARADIIKLDTQGYELEILQGAGALLSHAQVVLLEVSLLPINRGAPVFSDVVAFMHARGYKLFDFCSQIRRRDGVLWQTDLMFISPAALPDLEVALTKENWG
jgi:FkbM family methyltransferase